MNTSTLCKVSDTLRMEIAPTFPYSEREQIYAIADSIDAIIIELQLANKTPEDIRPTFKDSRTIYDVLGVH